MSSPPPIRSTEPPRVSVVIPCYNGEPWLAQAIDSVLDQTYQNFEIILVDDGSTDSTVALIRRYAAADPRIVLIEKSHTNLSDSLNVALARARGEWVARLDQDDLSAPTRLAAQMAKADSDPTLVFVGSAFVRIDESGHQVSEHVFPAEHRQLLKTLERFRGFCPHSTALFRVDAARRVGGYRERVNNANDWDLWLRLTAHGTLASLPSPLVSCRAHARQMSNDGGGEPQLIEGIASSACYFLRKHGKADPLDEAGPDAAQAFLRFVEETVRTSGLVRRRKTWAAARAAYFSKRNQIAAAAAFLAVLARSGDMIPLLRQKLFGLSLPKDIARRWRQ